MYYSLLSRTQKLNVEQNRCMVDKLQVKLWSTTPGSALGKKEMGQYWVTGSLGHWVTGTSGVAT